VRLLFVTQKLDADDPVLAQTVDLVRELALRFDHVDVLCDTEGRHEAWPNVRVRTFGAPSKAGRGALFLRGASASLLPKAARPDAVFVHMIPLFVLLLAPLAKALRLPLLLWYTHWHASRALRASVPLLDAALSVSAGSFPIATRKLVPTGHAIDVGRFAPGDRGTDPRLRLLALGRSARWKGYDTMLDAVERAVRHGTDARLEIRGPALTGDERDHRLELERRVADSPELRDRVRIEPPLARDELPALLAGADALLSATQPRRSETLDKVVYEAAACEVPVLASNEALEEFLAGLPLELSFPPRDAQSLAERIVALDAAGPEVRAETGRELRRRVVESHSVGSWAEAVRRIVAGQNPK
jgi:glycosyltransferase involved in cell wall biosynthesis